MRAPVTDPLQGLPLLRTCRQIYAESAMLPFRLNTFSSDYINWVTDNFRCMRAYQRAQIMDLQIDVRIREGACVPETDVVEVALSTRRLPWGRYKFDGLPALKRIYVLIFTKSSQLGSIEEKCKEEVLGQLNSLLPRRQVDVTFEVRQDSSAKYFEK